MKKYNAAVLLFSGLLASCTVGPDFVKPVAPAVETYTKEEQLEKFGTQQINPETKISETWWKEFSSPELNSVIIYGIEHSHTLASMKESVKQAVEQVNAQDGQLWPQLSLDAGAGRQKYGVALFGPVGLLIPPFTYYELGPSLTYLVDLFGVTRRSIEKQQALLEYQGHAYNAAFLTLSGNIVSTAIKSATLRAQIAAVKEIIHDDKENYRLVQVAFKLGSATKNEVLLAKTQLSQDEALLPPLLMTLKKSDNELNVLVSKSTGEWKPPRFSLSQFKLPKNLPLSLPSELVRTRPDILAAEAVLHAASADIGIATANMYPSITLSGNFMQEALTPSKLFYASSSAFSYLGNLSAPLFSGGTLSAQRRAAIHAYEASFSNYQQVVVKALVQVNDVLQALKMDEKEETIQYNTLRTAQEALRLARLSYQAGSVGTLEVLAAQREVARARVEHVKAKGQRYLDTVQLYLVLGGRQ